METVSGEALRFDDEKRTPSEMPDFSALDVLVIDDHAPMRRILKSVLEQFGISKVKEASNGAEALAMCAAYVPDFIITDYRMVPVDGIELTRKIRDGDTRLSPFTPIIMVSAYTEIDRILAARDAGINEFLAKPISAKLLFYRLRSITEKPRPFVRTGDFFGPDRRRRPTDGFGVERRAVPHDYQGQQRESAGRA